MKKGTAHRTYQSLGSVESWIAKGISDPLSHFQKDVDALNHKKAEVGVRKISDKSPTLYLGYFPFKSMLEKLHMKKFVDYFKLTRDFEFDLYELLSSLIYARAVNPCSKHRTFHEVLPYLYDHVDYSYDQLLYGLSFLGNDYEKLIEIFNVQVNVLGKTIHVADKGLTVPRISHFQRKMETDIFFQNLRKDFPRQKRYGYCLTRVLRM